jgi:hypothetical protein
VAEEEAAAGSTTMRPPRPTLAAQAARGSCRRGLRAAAEAVEAAAGRTEGRRGAAAPPPPRSSTAAGQCGARPPQCGGSGQRLRPRPREDWAAFAWPTGRSGGRATEGRVSERERAALRVRGKQKSISGMAARCKSRVQRTTEKNTRSTRRSSPGASPDSPRRCGPAACTRKTPPPRPSAPSTGVTEGGMKRAEDAVGGRFTRRRRSCRSRPPPAASSRPPCAPAGPCGRCRS